MTSEAKGYFPTLSEIKEQYPMYVKQFLSPGEKGSMIESTWNVFTNGAGLIAYVELLGKKTQEPQK